MAGLRNTLASDGQRFVQDINAAERDDKGSKSETFKMIEVMKEVIESNNTVIKKLDTIEASQKQLETHLKALHPRAPAYTVSASSTANNVHPLPAAPKGHSVDPPAPAYPSYSPSSSTTAATSPATITHTSSSSPDPQVKKPAREATPPAPRASKKARLAFDKAQWLDALEIRIQSATETRKRNNTVSSYGVYSRAKRFVDWYFPRHGCVRPRFKENNAIATGVGTLDEEWTWDVQMRLGGRVVWEERGVRGRDRVEDEQLDGTEDLARGLMALDPQGWKDFVAQDRVD
ncbi:hypothetical protein IAT38_004132 [Cryptococcus sp. DSM 104549]